MAAARGVFATSEQYIVIMGVGSLQSRGGAGPGADTASAAAQQLVTAALKKGTKDNVTAIVGLFQWQ